jgi:micrococcal nuclease
MNRRFVPVVLVLAAVALVSGFGDLEITTRSVDPPGDRREGRITKITDGDTIRIGEERIRLIGVDTPETRKPGTPVQCFGKKATAFATKAVLGRQVTLELDAEERDRYGRLLAYVRRSNDGYFLNAELVRQGYAQVLTIPPNIKYADRFLALQRRARAESRGLWRECR